MRGRTKGIPSPKEAKRGRTKGNPSPKEAMRGKIKWIPSPKEAMRGRIKGIPSTKANKAKWRKTMTMDSRIQSINKSSVRRNLIRDSCQRIQGQRGLLAIGLNNIRRW